MRTLFHLVSIALLGIGALVAFFGLLALAWAWLTPIQPPPSMNEGPGMVGLGGLYFLAMGACSVFMGLMIWAVLKASRPPHEIVSPDWARAHKRLW